MPEMNDYHAFNSTSGGSRRRIWVFGYCDRYTCGCGDIVGDRNIVWIILCFRSAIYFVYN